MKLILENNLLEAFRSISNHYLIKTAKNNIEIIKAIWMVDKCPKIFKIIQD